MRGQCFKDAMDMFAGKMEVVPSEVVLALLRSYECRKSLCGLLFLVAIGVFFCMWLEDGTASRV